MSQHEPLVFRDDCRHYLGDRPCRHNRLCADCAHYEPVEQRVCVIKIGALGDVIRTLCILPYLRAKHPGSRITWVTSPSAMKFIAAHDLIDEVLAFDGLNALALQHRAFDLLLSLDKEPAPTALAMSISATTKLGIALSSTGKPVPMNADAEPYFALGLSDELKFNQNRDSYPKLIYQAMGWRYHGERYTLPLSRDARGEAESILAAKGWSADRPTLGVNVGAAATFANKMWPPRRIIELIKRLTIAEPAAQVVLLGGPQEQQRIAEVAAGCPNTINSGHENSPRVFLGLIDCCDAVFCGDTLAMHLALARSRGVVAFFGPTCEQEIDLFGLGEKLVARTPCSPCYKRVCDQRDACLEAIEIGEALSTIRRVLAARYAERCNDTLIEKVG